ncbi:hypothetical protein GCM10011371_21510 [Novosphingobium marinum]|uniref:Uncharacterized protein n=1 Tax=Novosphingobium marinum TaxID=1514948 RepID=A0A7Y9XX97_9SPHN|nr:hypothetical protein [Novosphingobium marinum]NYH96264.1 hypothetical protein [Novosphingobium marinum]GGC33791.1 hypothetical protein GCM10011371_21510 [Novosphingobium marinum]
MTQTSNRPLAMVMAVAVMATFWVPTLDAVPGANTAYRSPPAASAPALVASATLPVMM